MITWSYHGHVPEGHGPYDVLMSHMATYTLMPLLAPFRQDGEHGVVYYGNFQEYSWAFHVTTDDPDAIARIGAAIDTNLSTEAYRTAASEMDSRVKERAERAGGAID